MPKLRPRSNYKAKVTSLRIPSAILAWSRNERGSFLRASWRHWEGSVSRVGGWRIGALQLDVWVDGDSAGHPSRRPIRGATPLLLKVQFQGQDYSPANCWELYRGVFIQAWSTADQAWTCRALKQDLQRKLKLTWIITLDGVGDFAETA